MLEPPLYRASVATSLEDEIDEAERMAMSAQAEADRLLARSVELASHARKRMAAVAVAQAALTGNPLPVVTHHDEPRCYESLPDWP